MNRSILGEILLFSSLKRSLRFVPALFKLVCLCVYDKEKNAVGVPPHSAAMDRKSRQFRTSSIEYLDIASGINVLDRGSPLWPNSFVNYKHVSQFIVST